MVQFIQKFYFSSLPVHVYAIGFAHPAELLSWYTMTLEVRVQIPFQGSSVCSFFLLHVWFYSPLGLQERVSRGQLARSLAGNTSTEWGKVPEHYMYIVIHTHKTTISEDITECAM